MKQIFIISLLILTAPFAGHAKTEPVRAVEGDISIPYESIGTLEVKTKAGGGIWGNTLRVLTLGFYHPSGSAHRKTLKAKLERKALKHYQAHAVIKVHYWPNPDAGSFPQGYIYARGEMVRYVQFPSKS